MMELKNHDLDVDDTSIAAAGQIWLNGDSEASLLRIPTGDGATTRDGRKIIIKQIGWRYNVELAAQTASATTSDVVRVILYLDKQANGAAAAVTDILQDDDYQSFNNLANKGRFRILMDRKYDMVAQAGGGNGTTEDYGEYVVSDTFFKKCNIEVMYNETASTGALATLRSANLGVLFLSKTGTLTLFRSKMRIRFIG